MFAPKALVLLHEALSLDDVVACARATLDVFTGQGSILKSSAAASFRGRYANGQFCEIASNAVWSSALFMRSSGSASNCSMR